MEVKKRATSTIIGFLSNKSGKKRMLRLCSDKDIMNAPKQSDKSTCLLPSRYYGEHDKQINNYKCNDITNMLGWLLPKKYHAVLKRNVRSVAL